MPLKAKPDQRTNPPQRTGNTPRAGTSARPSAAEAKTPDRSPKRSPSPTRVPGGLGAAITYEDASIVVADKPPSLATVRPRGSQAGTLLEAVVNWVEAAESSEHREASLTLARTSWTPVLPLDTEVSGLVLFARTSRAAEVLSEQVGRREAGHEFIAVVEGRLADTGSQGTLQSMLRPLASGKWGVVASPRSASKAPAGAKGARQSPGGKRAITRYSVIAATDEFTLIRIRQETSLPDQARVQLVEAGHPITGDRRYHAKKDPIGRLALHAAELFFVDASGERRRFRCAPASKMLGLVGLASLPGFTADTPIRATADKESDSSAAAAARPGRVKVVPPPPKKPAKTSWNPVAGWYDSMHAERRDDHYTGVIIPGVLRLLAPRPGDRLLDVACGQGAVSRELARAGAEVVGIDASEKLINLATRRAEQDPRDAATRQSYLVGDALNLDALVEPASFDLASCVMALSNMDPIGPVMHGMANALTPGGRAVIVISHPSFRIPKHTAWGWDADAGRQYRRVDAYLSPERHEITMNPGAVADGDRPVLTSTFHRPLSTYVEAASRAGLLIDAIEEWTSPRESTSGPRAEEENRSRREIPLFLAVRVVKPAVGPERVDPRSSEV